MAELRRKRDAERQRIATLTGQTMTLAEARKEVATLEGKVEEIRKEVEAAREEALKRSNVEKGPFETTAQYEARR